jgi:cytoskeletal protein CcmA (bactofilin family)
MARVEDILGVNGAETIVGAGATLTGTLAAEGDMLLDGTVSGTVHTNGDVTVGINGQVTAPVEAVNVTVAGSLVGDIKASGDVTIRETGNVQGNIVSTGLSIAPGGLFNGRSTIRKQHELNLDS